VDRVAAPEKRLLPPEIGAILEFTDGSEKGRQIPLLHFRTVLGRKFGDVLIRDLKVSSTHAALEYRGGAFHVIDLGSSNGTYINGGRVRDQLLEPGTEVRIGMSAFHVRLDVAQAVKLAAGRPREMSASEGGLSQLLDREFFHPELLGGKLAHAEVPEPLNVVYLKVLTGPDRGKEYSMDKATILLGRREADVAIADQDVSRKHALMERQEGGQYLLRDLASTNGTFVNDRRITNSVLSEGDRIRVGGTTLSFHLRASK